MTSKERVRAVMEHRKPDRVPAAFEAVGSVTEKLLKHYGFTDYSQLLEKYEIDIVTAGPEYIGPELKTYLNEKGSGWSSPGGGSKQPCIRPRSILMEPQPISL